MTLLLPAKWLKDLWVNILTVQSNIYLTIWIWDQDGNPLLLACCSEILWACTHRCLRPIQHKIWLYFPIHELQVRVQSTYGHYTYTLIFREIQTCPRLSAFCVLHHAHAQAYSITNVCSATDMYMEAICRSCGFQAGKYGCIFCILHCVAVYTHYIYWMIE